MIQRLFNFIAGVDYKTMVTCPPTDRMWASHIGFSLCLSFTVVLGVSFYATGYMIDSMWVRGGIAFVVAMTVLMFDRALCQSDWFYQGVYENTGADIQTHEEVKHTASRFLRISVRFGMSLGLAWVIAMFMELAIFSDTISEKIERDRVANNKPIFDKIEGFESQLTAEIERNRATVTELETALRSAAAEVPMSDAATAAGTEEIAQQVKKIGAREEELRVEIAQIEQSIRRYTEEMNAEEFGQKLFPSNSGRVGTGVRYEFAKRQKEAYEAQLPSRQDELTQLLIKREALRKADSDLLASTLAMRENELAMIQAKRESLQSNLEKARAALKQSELEKAARSQEFRTRVLAESYFLGKKDYVDPLRRIAALQDLKNDPKDGPIITLFSWMTRFFVIFLEIVPVVAKIFFSPPSVYAAKIQARIRRERRGVQLAEEPTISTDDAPARAHAEPPRRPTAQAFAPAVNGEGERHAGADTTRRGALDWWDRIAANRAAMLETAAAQNVAESQTSSGSTSTVDDHVAPESRPVASAAQHDNSATQA